MKKSTKIVLVALAAILLVSTVAVLAPRATHANTTPQPITFSPTADRIPWVTACGPKLVPDGLFCVTPPTPAGYEVVIQSLSFMACDPEINLASGITQPLLFPRLNTTTGGNPNAIWVTTLVPPLLSGNYYSAQFTFQTNIYVDPDTNIGVWLGFDSATGTIVSYGPASAILQGYAVKLERSWE